jgi:hypothetical protein
MIEAAARIAVVIFCQGYAHQSSISAPSTGALCTLIQTTSAEQMDGRCQCIT